VEIGTLRHSLEEVAKREGIADPRGFLWSIAILAGATGIVLWLLKRSGVLRR
jgi:hypothetical protein